MSAGLPPFLWMGYMWKNFSLQEFACQCGCDTNEINRMFVDQLQELRDACEFPLIINSGYRCHNHPLERGKINPGPHHTGRAVDIKCSYERADKILREAVILDFGGIGIRQHGTIGKRIIHLDGLGDRLWTYES